MDKDLELLLKCNIIEIITDCSRAIDTPTYLFSTLAVLGMHVGRHLGLKYAFQKKSLFCLLPIQTVLLLQASQRGHLHNTLGSL